MQTKCHIANLFGRANHSKKKENCEIKTKRKYIESEPKKRRAKRKERKTLCCDVMMIVMMMMSNICRMWHRSHEHNIIDNKMHASNKNTKSELDGSIVALWLLLHQSLECECACVFSCWVAGDARLECVQRFSCIHSFLHFVFDMMNVLGFFFCLLLTLHTRRVLVAHARIR